MCDRWVPAYLGAVESLGSYTPWTSTRAIRDAKRSYIETPRMAESSRRKFRSTLFSQKNISNLGTRLKFPNNGTVRMNPASSLQFAQFACSPPAKIRFTLISNEAPVVKSGVSKRHNRCSVSVALWISNSPLARAACSFSARRYGSKGHLRPLARNQSLEQWFRNWLRR
jgi:hypothetical protein